MAISCAPADLAAAAKCFQCLPSEQKQWIDTYLLAVIAGGSTDPNTLALAAKCFQCIPPGMLRRIQAYLLCQVASGGGGGGCDYQDMQVAWTPTNLKLGELMGFVSFDNNTALPGITTLTFNQATTREAIDIEVASDLTSVSAPNLVSVTADGYIAFAGNPVLSSISMPLLASIATQSLSVSTNAITGTLSFPALTSVGMDVSVQGETQLTAISLPVLTTVGRNVRVNSCTSLTSASLPVFAPINGKTVSFNGCALSAASVNHVLARCIANVGYVTGQVDLQGGTNAAPSGQGIADKAALILRGVTVDTN